MDDDILARELDKIGRAGAEIGEIGGALLGVETISGTGVSLGAQAAARFLPTEVFSEQRLLNVPADKALRLGFSVLSRLGDLQRGGPEEVPHPSLRAIVRAGLLNMSPTVVYFEILRADSSSCTVKLTGAAKEGLIRQRIAEKAVHRVMSALREAVDQSAG